MLCALFLQLLNYICSIILQCIYNLDIKNEYINDYICPMKWKNALHDYQFFLKIEKGLAKNSIESYARDVKKLIAYLDENDIAISPLFINQETESIRLL